VPVTLAGLERLLAGDADARPIALVRVVVGVTAFARIFEARRIFARLLAPTTIRLPYVAWLPTLPDAGVPWLLALWAGAALLFALGLATRVAGVVLAAVLLYVVLLDEQTYSNHLYLLALVVLLLVLANAGAAYALDARRAAATTHQRAHAWAVFLLKTQVAATYAFAGLTKVNATYLSGATMAAYMSADVLAALPDYTRLPLVLAFSWGSIVIELWLAWALWRPRLRIAAVAVGAALHAGMIALLPPGVRFQLAIFAVEMLALYVVFFVATPALGTPAPVAAARAAATEG
jgi:hypothetical protein